MHATAAQAPTQVTQSGRADPLIDDEGTGSRAEACHLVHTPHRGQLVDLPADNQPRDGQTTDEWSEVVPLHETVERGLVVEKPCHEHVPGFEGRRGLCEDLSSVYLENLCS
jgi:hypothetical protein